MEKLKAALKNMYEEIICKKASFITNETITLNSLVNPFLQVLEYNPSDPSEVIYEYDADARLKKANKVAIAILKNNQPLFFIECKKLGENLDAHEGQLNAYFVAVPEVEFAILTNGSEYRFYKEGQEKSNTMSKTPFLTIDLTKTISDSQLKTLKTFSKSEFDKDALNSSIDYLATETAIKKFMNTLVSKEIPFGDDVLSILAKDTPFKHKKGENREKFSKLADKFIRMWVEELVQERINNLAKQQASENKEKEPEEDLSGIITTEQEMEAFYIIKGMCSEKIPAHEIEFQDYMSLFKIYFGGKKDINCICKLYLDEKMEIEIVDKERIAFKSLQDLYSFKSQLFEKIDSLK